MCITGHVQVRAVKHIQLYSCATRNSARPVHATLWPRTYSSLCCPLLYMQYLRYRTLAGNASPSSQHKILPKKPATKKVGRRLSFSQPRKVSGEGLETREEFFETEDGEEWKCTGEYTRTALLHALTLLRDCAALYIVRRRLI